MAEAPTIEEAQSLGDLFQALDNKGKLRGSKKTYIASELRGLVDKVTRGELPIEYITRTDGLRAKVAELLAFQTDVSQIRERFKGGVKEGKVSEVYEGWIDNLFWQLVRYGKEPQNDSGNLYRGYLMVEPEDFPRALELLAHIGEQRMRSGKKTQFKWLLKAQAKNWKEIILQGKEAYKTPKIGDYRYLEETDPRIVLYADRPIEIQEILDLLSQDPKWQGIEENRKRKFSEIAPAPRRPGTNSYIDTSGNEWRSLNYNENRGYSENEAKDPNWRSRKIGSFTNQNI